MLSRRLIGFPCPVCGTSMLTEADYKAARRQERLFSLLKLLGIARSPDPGRPARADEIALEQHVGANFVIMSPKTEEDMAKLREFLR